MSSRAVVHVEITPAAAYEARPRLFAALESMLPVRFLPANSGPADGAVVFCHGDLPEHRAIRRPTLVLVDDQSRARGEAVGLVRFGQSDLLPRAFRGRTLTDSSTSASALSGVRATQDDVLATHASGPVWVSTSELVQLSSAWPTELRFNETLRTYLSPNSFMGLLPLVHFVKTLAAKFCVTFPQSSASFLIDDPNLHWWSYGFLDYRKLAEHSEAHDYHLTVATIPIDQLYVHRPTVAFLRERTRRISFVIHGNDHTNHELRRIDDIDAATALSTQALERTARLKDMGLEVGAVMIPPFGVCSMTVIEALQRTGFDALCADWPYWWLPDDESVSPSAGCHPLDRLGGLPVIPRLHANSGERDDLLFRAFLGQPVVLYIHHTDLRDGLDVLEARAEEIRSLGVASWTPVGRIAKGAVAVFRRDETVVATLYSQTATIELETGSAQIEVHLAESARRATSLRLELNEKGGWREIPPGARVDVAGGCVSVRLRLDELRSTRPAATPSRAVFRRLLTEGRDRMLPLSSRRSG